MHLHYTVALIQAFIALHLDWSLYLVNPLPLQIIFHIAARMIFLNADSDFLILTLPLNKERYPPPASPTFFLSIVLSHNLCSPILELVTDFLEVS